ncbi:hypothetical protein C8A03DRAFT_38230 [Achaetomium macrosporum]|uniref:Uncharacterized protein n=1 Tax=Achaetomium macrosporum TaxID=79813 RepID=A0AAN7HAN3_9PEZI|nr:hypothetical protein C8A03DRAFT_38230 [Achaetomium macrosporum]
MDGSYGNVFPTGRAMPPSAPAPSNTNQYKVNVNRQKTKKWANFKPQNYDGDDWGDDYDEPAYEPEPPPPPKPIGPRHSPTARQFQPPGSGPLRTHTQQFPTAASVRPGQNQLASGPSSLPSMTPRRATEPIGTAPHAVAGHAHPAFSPDGRRGSAAPPSAHPLPSQLRQSGASPRPSEDSKPWMKTGSPSPVSARSPASPNKALPLIRPADVYRRMEEERQKERRSSESGRPGAGDVSVPETQRHGESQALQPADGFAPIAERKSEYGIEGILASYRTEQPGVQSATAQEQEKSAESQKFVQSVSHEALRRFSKSPQLPDLSRMSGFGEDLFSSSFFPSSGLRSPVSASFPTSGQVERVSTEPAEPTVPATAGPPGPSADTATHQSVASITERVSGSEDRTSRPVSSVNLNSDALSSLPDAPNRDQPIGQPLQQGKPSASQPVFDATEQHASAAVSPREPASHTADPPATTATRPPMPGGWVTETLSTPGELPGNATEPKGVPSETDAAAAERVAASLNVTKIPQTEPQEAALLKGTDTAKASPVPSHPASPHILPPLRTSSPALSTKFGMGSQQATPEVQLRNVSPSPGIQTIESSSPMPTSADTEHSEVTPTAPLNPRRATPDVRAISQSPVPPAPFEAAPALEVSTDSPVKDSDVLSEEILKSLSPGQPVAGVTNIAEGSTTTSHAPVADPTRESSYLGDVYGDYWATTEDKADPGVLAAGRADEPEKTAQNHSPLSPDPPTDIQAVVGSPRGSTSSSIPSIITPAKGPEIQAETATENGGLRRRFSWEAALEGSVPVSLSSPGAALSTEQKALGSGAETVGAPAAKLTAPETEPSRAVQSSEGMKSADDLRAESAPEVLGPTPSADRRRGSPSPLSAPSDEQNDSKRLSLAEEKIVLQPVLPSPPLEQHPVFAATQESRRAEPPIPPSPQNILGFRNIMEMSLASERIRHYNETRWQFSTVDTGLDDWLKAMLSRHPEHANAVLSYSSAAAPQIQQGSQGAAQAAGQGGRAPAYLHMPHLQHGLGGLGHSSNQMGTKSKELLMAAGKAGKGFGKGLLSKGRNKFRGTGDKVFSSS